MLIVLDRCPDRKTIYLVSDRVTQLCLGPHDRFVYESLDRLSRLDAEKEYILFDAMLDLHAYVLYNITVFNAKKQHVRVSVGVASTVDRAIHAAESLLAPVMDTPSFSSTLSKLRRLAHYWKRQGALYEPTRLLYNVCKRPRKTGPYVDSYIPDRRVGRSYSSISRDPPEDLQDSLDDEERELRQSFGSPNPETTVPKFNV